MFLTVRLVVVLIAGLLLCPITIACSPIAWLNGSTETFDFQFQRSLLHVVALERFSAGRPDNLITELSRKRGIEASTIPEDPRSLWDTHVCLIPQLHSMFQREQWTKARDEINGYDVDRVMKSYTRPKFGDVGYDPQVLKFYLHPYYMFHMTTNGHNLNYFTIYKAASTYVHNLLADYCTKSEKRQKLCSWSEMYLFEWLKKDKMKRQKILLRKRDGQCSFAIVRDPMARFISGYTEVEQRRRDKKANETKIANKAAITSPSKPAVVTPLKAPDFKCLKGMKCVVPLKAPVLDAQSKRRHWEEKVSNDDRLETFIFWLLRYDGSHSMVRECPECDHITPQGMLDCWMVVL